MIKSQYTPKGSFAIPGTNRAFSPDLLSNRATQLIALDFSATLTLGGVAATAQLDGGSLLAAVREVVLSDNGQDEVVISGMELLAINRAMGTEGIRARISTFAAGAQVLTERIVLPLTAIFPHGISPMETPYIQRDGSARLSVAVSLKSGGDVNGIMVETAGTAVLSAVTCNVMQESDRTARAVIALPRMEISARQAIPGVLNNLDIPIRTPHHIRGLIIHGTTDNRGDVGDIIQSIAMRSDSTEIIGPQLIPFADAVQIFGARPAGGNPGTLGGRSTVAGAEPGGVYLFLDFLRLGSGRLSNLIGPRVGANLRLVVNVAPSAVAGATGSAVAVTSLLLRREGAAGLVIPRAEIPFPFA